MRKVGIIRIFGLFAALALLGANNLAYAQDDGGVGQCAICALSPDQVVLTSDPRLAPASAASPGLCPVLPGDGSLFLAGDGTFKSAAVAPSPTPWRSRMPLDNNVISRWGFAEFIGASYLANDVSGAGNMTTSGVALIGAPGVFNNAVSVVGGRVQSDAAAAEPAYPMSASVWVMLTSYPTSGNLQGVQKTWNADGFGPNYRSISPFIGVSNGNISAVVQTAGYQDNWLSWQNVHIIPLFTWVHFAITYDGAEVRWYYNGQLIGVKPQTGAIQYGNHGRWVIGQPAGDTADPLLTFFADDLQIDNTSRAASYWQTLYKQGIGSP